MGKNKLAKAAGIIMIVSLVSKAIGFFRDALTGSAFGATGTTDAYQVSLMIPNILFGLFGLAITTTFIPILSETYKKQGKEEMFKFANSIMNILMIISVVLCILGWIFTPQIVKMVASNFKDDTYNLAVILTEISIINIVFLSLNSGYTAVLQTLDEFTAPSLVGIVMNIPIITYILLGNKYGIVGLTVVTVIGNGLQILIQLPWLMKHKYKYSFKIDFKDSKIKKMLMLIAPVIIGTGVNQIGEVIQKKMASGLPAGSITALDFANKLHGLVYFTFAAAIVTVVYPSLSREGSLGQYENLKKRISHAVNNINLIMIPACIGLLVLRVPIIRILFKHGAFDERAVQMTSVALLYLASGMIFWGIRDIFSKTFYAIQDTRTPMINGAIGVVANMILSVILVKSMGIGGLTLSTTIAAFVSCVLLAKDLRKKIGNINGMEMFVSGSKIMTASVVMGVCIYFINHYMNPIFNNLKGQLLIIAICIVVALVVYVLMLMLLKAKEITDIINMLKAKVKR